MASETYRNDIRTKVESATKYVCRVEDLDRLLDDTLKAEFQAMFPDPSTGDKTAWRMYYGKTAQENNDPLPEEDMPNPRNFLKDVGIDFDHPTVRDAVAFDFVKLDDDSVSNTNEYTYPEHIEWSRWEYERFLLNRNFRINLVNLEQEWSDIKYHDSQKDGDGGTEIDIGYIDIGETGRADGDSSLRQVVKRTVERVFQGVVLSDSLLGYFQNVFQNGFGEDGNPRTDVDPNSVAYVPFTNANDFTQEFSLVPNTHDMFSSITTRAYYDGKHLLYRKHLRRHGISAISSFALVDPEKDKNHTGEYLVKVQRKLGDGRFQYIVARIDKDGQMKGVERTWTSERNEVLSVAESDFLPRDEEDVADGVWTPDIRDVPMVHSTTSAQHSIFRQRIPDYDLRQVRHYLQFKNRLDGMELCLENLERNIHSKRNQASECFARETMAIWRLFREFLQNRDLMECVKRYYDLLAEFDSLTVKRARLMEVKDSKQKILQSLTDEYLRLGNNQMDRKLELGQKIASLKLELDKSMRQQVGSIDARLEQIADECRKLRDEIQKRQNGAFLTRTEMEEFQADLGEVFSSSQKDIATGEIDGLVQDMLADIGYERPRELEESSSSDGIQVVDEEEDEGSEDQEDASTDSQDAASDASSANTSSKPPELTDDDIDITRYHELVLLAERWRGFMLNLGWEIQALETMYTMCSDATIKVRRLLHNFAERMADVEEQVWDENHMLRPDFSFVGISTAGIQDIILLHDWYACNAPGKTFEDMGFKDKDEFMEFRMRCNKISYNLRKNQYAQMLAVRRDRLEDRVQALKDTLANAEALKYDDKYGWEARKEQEKDEEQEKNGKKWSVADVTSRQARRIMLVTESQKVMEQIRNSISAREARTAKALARKSSLNVYVKAETELRQYGEDAERLAQRTFQYLKELGIVETEEDLDSLAARNLAMNYEGDVYSELQKVQTAKDSLDEAISNMDRQRKSMSSMIDGMTQAEMKVLQLQQENKRIFDACLVERNRQHRNRLLVQKMENEQKILQLKGVAKSIRDRNAKDFSTLEGLRKEVDRLQAEYDSSTRRFKTNIGLSRDAVDRLMVGIYNKFQDEILEHGKTRKHK